VTAPFSRQLKSNIKHDEKYHSYPSFLKQKVHIRANNNVGSALVKITIVDKKVPGNFLASLSYQDVSGRQHLQAPGLANSH
jgi:hypothetical protein